MTDQEKIARIDAAIRRVPDFPKPGILFYDITGLLIDPQAFAWSLDLLARAVEQSGADTLAAIEARGFVFAAPLAQRLGLPLVLVRKKGKLPNPVVSANFNLEYGTDTVCVQRVDLERPRSFFVVDDLIATGGTLSAACGLMETQGSRVAGIGAVIGLPFLGFHQVLAPRPVHTVVDYHSE